MKTLYALPALLVAVAAALTSQPHGTGYVAAGLANLHAISAVGQVTSRGVPGFRYALLMDRDNKTVLAHDFTRRAILRYDAATLAVLGTAYTHAHLGNSDAVQSLAFDSNGDLVFGSRVSGKEGLFKFVNSTTFTTVISAAFASEFADIRDAIVDMNTADWIVAGLPNQSLYRVRRDGVAFTTLATGFSIRYGITQDIVTGDVYVGTCCGTGSGGQSLHRLAAGQSTPTVFLDHPTLRAGYAPTMDRASAASRSLVTSTWADSNTPGSDGIWRVDLANAAVTKLASINISTPGFSTTYHVVHTFGRNLQTVRTGAGQWNIDLSFPGLANQRYYVVPSLAGVRPGIRLPDGRRIPLNLDSLSVASLNGLLGPLLPGSTGLLQNGVAQAQLNLGGLFPALVGARLWFGAIVIDASAPLGIAVIPDPVVLAVE